MRNLKVRFSSAQIFLLLILFLNMSLIALCKVSRIIPPPELHQRIPGHGPQIKRTVDYFQNFFGKTIPPNRGQVKGLTNIQRQDQGNEEVDQVEKELEEALGILRPMFFLLPFVIASLPLAIPAVPISLYLAASRSSSPGE